MTKVLVKEIEEKTLSPEDQAVFDQVMIAVAAADDKKATDMLVLRLVEITEFTDYFIICTGNSTRQIQAIADAITDKLKEIKLRPLHTEGYNTGEWILMDYGVFVVHIFTPESRKFYDLERLWRDAEKIEL